MRQATAASTQPTDGWLSCSFAALPVVEVLVVEGKRGRPFDVAAKPVGNDFHDTDLRCRNLGHSSIRLAHVIPGQDAMYETVFGLHQPVRTIGQAQRAYHSQRIERK